MHVSCCTKEIAFIIIFIGRYPFIKIFIMIIIAVVVFVVVVVVIILAIRNVNACT